MANYPLFKIWDPTNGLQIINQIIQDINTLLLSGGNSVGVQGVTGVTNIQFTGAGVSVAGGAPTSTVTIPGGGSISPPSPSTLGGVFSNAGISNRWITTINTDGSVTLLQPAFTNISGVATPAQLPVFGAAAAGAVSASGGGTANFLRADGSWVVPPGGGGGSTPTVLQQRTTNATTTSFTLAAGDISGGYVEHSLEFTGNNVSPTNATLPTVANLVASFSPVVGQTYKLRITNSGSSNWTIVTNTGWTINGVTVINPDTFMDYYVTFTSLVAATLQSV